MAQLAANSVEGRAQAYLARIETLLADIDSERGTYMARCKELREDISGIYVEAKDNGVPVKALKGIVKHRQLQKKQDAIAAGFDIDEAAAYETLVEMLGELGAAAAKRAGHDPKPEAKAAQDAENLQKVGRGPQPAA